MPRWMWFLLPIGVAGFALSYLHAPEGLLFGLTAVGIIPLAALIGKATEELAYRVGSATGGLLNVTFGNVPELIVGALAIRANLVPLAQATIIGSVIGNASLVVGMSLFWGGIRNGIQRFSREVVGHHAVLMILSVASLALPSLFAVTSPRHNVETLSAVVACLLIASYGAYMLYDIAGLRGGRGRQPQTGDVFSGEQEAVVALVQDEQGPEWSWQWSVFWLILASIMVALEGEVLLGTVRPVTAAAGVSELFVGLVIIPIVGNVAEHFSAVILAGKNKMDLSFGVASGSAIQVALFVAPVLVLLSFLWHPMTLVFNPIEIAVLALVVGIFFFVSQDGESNWLEGLQLMMLYSMAAIVFYFLP
ncbi:MAG TPA: calcium/proton exchanger [Chloroflexota bacterium]|nr:calcium/proton exchanger [Chloroflexota bacterium]